MIHLFRTVNEEVLTEPIGNHSPADESGVQYPVDGILARENAQVRIAEPEAAPHLAPVCGLADEMDQVARINGTAELSGSKEITPSMNQTVKNA